MKRREPRKPRYRRVLIDITADTTGPSWKPKTERTFGRFKGKERRASASHGRMVPSLCFQEVIKEPRGSSVANPAMCAKATRSVGQPGRPTSSVLRRVGESKARFFCEVYE